jgi:YD repeat-containing protein
MFRPLVLVTAAVTAVSGALVVAPGAAHASPRTAVAHAVAAHPAEAFSGVVVLAPQRYPSIGGDVMASLLGSAPKGHVFMVPMAVPNPLTGLGVYDNESLTPKLSAVASDPDGGTVTTKFFARYVGDSSWTIMNAVAVSGASGSRVYAQVPAGKLSAGQALQWAAQACDATSCSALSAVQTGYASPAVGAGQVPGATFLDRTLSDTISVKVNVGTGNLLVRATGLSLPGIGTDLKVGTAFNSLNLAAGSRYTGGGTGRGWRFSTGSDQSVVVNSTGSVSYFGPDGLVDLFRPSGASYVSVNGQKHVLDKMSGADPNIPGSPSSTYRITENTTGTRLYFNTIGHLIAAYDRHQQKTAYTYDASNHLTSITSTRSGAGANTVTVTPWATSPGRISSLTQTTASGPATSRTLGYGYDGSDHLSTITDAAGQVTTFGYTVDDLTSITTASGQVTTFTFDSRHRVTSMT